MKFTRFEHSPQHRGEMIDVRVRISSEFAEVRRGLAESPDHALAAAEAARCLSCGDCNSCDLCREHCPEGVLVREGDFYAFDYEYCKGCGLCASECPRGVVYMEQI